MSDQFEECRFAIVSLPIVVADFSSIDEYDEALRANSVLNGLVE